MNNVLDQTGWVGLASGSWGGGTTTLLGGVMLRLVKHRAILTVKLPLTISIAGYLYRNKPNTLQE